MPIEIDEVSAAIGNAVDIRFPGRQPRARMHAEHDPGAALAQLLDELAILLERAVADFGLAHAHGFERRGDAQLLVDARHRRRACCRPSAAYRRAGRCRVAPARRSRHREVIQRRVDPASLSARAGCRAGNRLRSVQAGSSVIASSWARFRNLAPCSLCRLASCQKAIFQHTENSIPIREKCKPSKLGGGRLWRCRGGGNRC